MGAGDSKLIGVCGFYLNIYGGLIMLAIFAGWLLISMAFMYFRQIDNKTRVPLAPFISLSAALTMLIGYTRLMRRTIRRSGDTAEGQQLIAETKKRLIELVDQTDSLDF